MTLSLSLTDSAYYDVALSDKPAKLVTLTDALLKVDYYKSVVLGMNPVAYWPLNEVSGSVANDAVLGQNNASYNSCTLNNLPGPGASMGNAPYFDGVLSNVQLPATGLNSLFNPNVGTMGIWINRNELWSAAPARDIMSLGADINNFEGLFVATNTADCTDKRSGTGVAVLGNETVSGWHHVLSTWNVPGNLSLFIDGLFIASHAVSTGAWVGALTLAFIGRVFGYGYFLGWLQHAAVFNRVLTQPEITKLATAA